MKIILFLFFVSFVNIYSLPISQQILEKNKWDADAEISSGNIDTISFKNGKVNIEFQYYTDPHRSEIGTYSIKNNKVYIKIDKIKIMEEVTDGKPYTMECILEKTTKSLFYSQILKCNESNSTKEYYNLSSKLKNGDKVNIENLEAIIFNKKMTSTGSTLMVRSAPDTKSEPVEWYIEGKNGSILRKSLNKGDKVQVIARTKEKKNVGKMNNYWYYVEIKAINPDHSIYIKVNGWVYGEFLK